MPALESTLELRRSEIIVGEPISLRIVLRNPGTAPVEVPNLLGPDEFDFVLRRGSETGVFTVLNAQQARLRRSVDPIRIATPQRHTLAPATEATYQVAPSAYWQDPLPSGSYALSVAYGAGPAPFDSRQD